MDAATLDDGIPPWLQNTLKEAITLGSSHVVPPHQQDVGPLSRPGKIPPEQLAYFQKLVDCMVQGRSFIFTYNCILLAVLAILTVSHVLEKGRCRRRCQERETSSARARSGERSGHLTLDSASASSSSTSSSPRITTPSGAQKDCQIDMERLPLLGFRRADDRKHSSVFTRAQAQLRAWLEYQPRPLPVVNRVLPSNGTSLLVASWLAFHLFMQFYKIPLQLDFTLAFAARAGDQFIANLPLLYLLAAKNQPVKILTGFSYEALNFFHRRVGEWMCFQAFVHTVGEVLVSDPSAASLTSLHEPPTSKPE